MLLHDRHTLLDSIDFDWGKGVLGRPNTDWMEMYQRLVLYKMQHKNTNVPRTYKDDPKLMCAWINTQRKNYKKTAMKEERVSLLWILLVSIGGIQKERASKIVKRPVRCQCHHLRVPVGRVVHTHHTCAPNNTTDALGSSFSSSSCRRSSLTSHHGPILDDSSDDKNDEAII